MSFYIAASYVIFIQRKKILKSGNITLGFLFGKIVNGPDKGNVGEILRLTENPVFDPDDIKSVVYALNETYILAKSNHGKTNYDFSMRNYNIRHISRLYIKEYNRLINNSDRS